MLSLCPVTTRSEQPCVATTVNYTTQRRKCCLLTAPPMSVSGNRCHTSPLPLAPADQEEEGRMSGGRSKPSVTFTFSIQLSSLALTSVNTTPTTPLPYHLPLHPVTMTTSQPTGSALRCVPLPRRLFHIPLSSSSAENTPCLPL